MLALAHALELRGKMRLYKDTHLVVQTIYYPGFTFGEISDTLGMLATVVLLLMTASHRPAFWWTLTGLCRTRRHVRNILDDHSSGEQILVEGHALKRNWGEDSSL